jgi:hypothetical protein
MAEQAEQSHQCQVVVTQMMAMAHARQRCVRVRHGRQHWLQCLPRYADVQQQQARAQAKLHSQAKTTIH